MLTRVSILGDSLSMPRPSEGIVYESTYPFLLAENGYEVICKSKRANDTKIQSVKQNILDDVLFLNPEIVIIHLGIVDCAPRLFKRREIRLLNLLPIRVRTIVINFFSKYRYVITKTRKITYVNNVDYRRNLSKIIKDIQSENRKIILIKILDTNSSNLLRSFGFSENIKKYNEIIDDIAIALDLDTLDPNLCNDGLLSDGIHINKKMHEYIAMKVSNLIENV